MARNTRAKETRPRVRRTKEELAKGLTLEEVRNLRSLAAPDSDTTTVTVAETDATVTTVDVSQPPTNTY